MKYNIRLISFALLIFTLLFWGLDVAFTTYKYNQDGKILRGIESLLLDETTIANSYLFARRLRTLETIGLITCTRFSEVSPISRPYYDSTYLPACNLKRLNQHEFKSMDQSRTWKLEVMIASTPLELYAKYSLVALILISFVIAVGSIIKMDLKARKAESEHRLLRELTLQVKHDIASPLGALQMATQFPDLSPRLKDFLELAVGRTKEIFSDLGRLDDLSNSGPETFSLKEVVTAIAREKNSPRLRVSVVDRALNGSRKEFARSISNMINNGLEASSSSEVRIFSSVDPVGLIIQDSGPGFPQVVLQGIRRNLSVGKPGGSGLGLAHAQQALRAMKISLRLSNTSEGARIELHFDQITNEPVG